MKLIKELKWEALLKGVLYTVLGVAALMVSDQMVKALGYSIGAILILAGAVSMISYLLRDPRQNYYHDDFAYGLLGIVLGGLVLYKVEFIISMVPFFLGMLVLVSGITKLQAVIDMKRLECGNWVGMLVLAVLNVVLGVVLILDPFDAEVLFKVLGAGLIFSGVTDTIVSIYFAGEFAKYKRDEAAKEKEKAEKEERELDKAAEKPVAVKIETGGAKVYKIESAGTETIVTEKSENSGNGSAETIADKIELAEETDKRTDK